MTLKEALVSAGVAEEEEEDRSPSIRVVFTERGDEDVYLQLAGYELSSEPVVIELDE